VLTVVQNLNLDAKGILHASLYSINRSVSNAFKGLLNAMIGVGYLSQCCKLAVSCLRIGYAALSEVQGSLRSR
jgi:hypothetical protein